MCVCVCDYTGNCTKFAYEPWFKSVFLACQSMRGNKNLYLPWHKGSAPKWLSFIEEPLCTNHFKNISSCKPPAARWSRYAYSHFTEEETGCGIQWTTQGARAMTQQSQDSSFVNQNPKSTLLTTLWCGLLRPRLAAQRSTVNMADAVGWAGQGIKSRDITQVSKEEEWPQAQAGNREQQKYNLGDIHT